MSRSPLLRAVLFLAMAAAPVSGADTERVTVKVDALKMRSAPSLTAGVVGELQKGQVVEQLESGKSVQTIGGMKNRWRRVKTAEGKEGWVFGAYLVYDQSEWTFTAPGDACFMVTDPAGKRAGCDPAKPETTLDEIPKASYRRTGETTALSVRIPRKGRYKVSPEGVQLAFSGTKADGSRLSEADLAVGPGFAFDFDGVKPRFPKAAPAAASTAAPVE